MDNDVCEQHSEEPVLTFIREDFVLEYPTGLPEKTELAPPEFEATSHMLHELSQVAEKPLLSRDTQPGQLARPVFNAVSGPVMTVTSLDSKFVPTFALPGEAAKLRNIEKIWEPTYESVS